MIIIDVKSRRAEEEETETKKLKKQPASVASFNWTCGDSDEETPMKSVGPDYDYDLKRFEVILPNNQ